MRAPRTPPVWMEYLYSDAGQLAWLAGYAKPVRFDDLVKNDAIPEELAASCPLNVLRIVAFPTVEQIIKVADQIEVNWTSKFGLAIAAPLPKAG